MGSRKRTEYSPVGVLGANGLQPVQVRDIPPQSPSYRLPVSARRVDGRDSPSDHTHPLSRRLI